MTNSFEFYFDFASPYGFLAERKVMGLAEKIGRHVNWRPFLLGAVYKTHGGAPLGHPLKADYMFTDVFRRATLSGLEGMKKPANFPASSVPPSRLAYWVEREAPERMGEFIHAAFQSYWMDGRDTSDVGATLDIVERMGLDRIAAADGVQTSEIKNRLRDVTEQALAKGVFGSPFILIDNQPYWGADRFDDVEALHGQN